MTVHPNLNGFSQFGFGKRTCQGIPIVDQDLFLAMGGMAWAFNLRKKRRADGSEVPVHWNDYTPLLIAKPMPFEFDATVRSEEKEVSLAQMWETGKGDDDVEEERNQFLELTSTKGAPNKIDVPLSPHDDDGASDRGSETSGAAGSLMEDSVASVSTGSDSDIGDSDSSTPGLKPISRRGAYVSVGVE